VPKRNKSVLVDSLKKVFDIYTKIGFTIKTALMDREFEYLRDDIRCVTLNTMVASKHVPDIELHMRVIKDRAMSIISNLLFDTIPNRVVVDMLNFVVLWLNAFQPLNDVSDIYSIQSQDHHDRHDPRMQTNTVSCRSARMRIHMKNTCKLTP
jgi:hypothetical protein